MTILNECLENETLNMDINWHRGRITIGYPIKDKDQYVSIIIHAGNYAQIFPNLEEVDLIIGALQKAKNIIKEKENNEIKKE